MTRSDDPMTATDASREPASDAPCDAGPDRFLSPEIEAMTALVAAGAVVDAAFAHIPN